MPIEMVIEQEGWREKRVTNWLTLLPATLTELRHSGTSQNWKTEWEHVFSSLPRFLSQPLLVNFAPNSAPHPISGSPAYGMLEIVP